MVERIEAGGKVPDWGNSNPYPSYLAICPGCGQPITRDELDHDECENCRRLDNVE